MMDTSLPTDQTTGQAPPNGVPSTYVLLDRWDRPGTELYVHPDPAIRSGVMIAPGAGGDYEPALRFQFYSDGEVYWSDWLGPAESWDEAARARLLAAVTDTLAPGR
jgi:hypothetical protein